MAGSDEGKNDGKMAGLSCCLKGDPSFVNFHPAIFCLNTFPKFTTNFAEEPKQERLQIA